MRRGVSRSPFVVLAAAALAVGAWAWPSFDSHPAGIDLPVGCHGPEPTALDAAGRVWELAELQGQELKGAYLRGVYWPRVMLRGTTFTACDLQRANLQGADLSGASFWESDLREANLAGADLRGVAFDRFTRWPAGFDPTAHGARLDE